MGQFAGSSWYDWSGVGGLQLQANRSLSVNGPVLRLPLLCLIRGGRDALRLRGWADQLGAAHHRPAHKADRCQGGEGARSTTSLDATARKERTRGLCVHASVPGKNELTFQRLSR